MVKITRKKLKKRVLLFPVLGIILLSLVSLSVMFDTVGLSKPEPIAAYLNGAFPSKINSADVQLVPAFPNITFNSPLAMEVHPTEDKIFVAQRDGQIFYFTDAETVKEKTLFLDLREEVGVHFDGGLYNMVLHPNFGKPNAVGRNYVYTYYSTPSLTGVHDKFSRNNFKCESIDEQLFDGSYLVLRRYEVREGTLQVDLSKTLDMIKIRLYNAIHRGSGMTFGQDGMLYLGIGDLDIPKTSQEMDLNFNGGILRLDVNMDKQKSHPPTYVMPKQLPEAPDEISGNGYYIPNDNPFVGRNNTFEEYFSLGFRNPFRLTVDRETGALFLGEIGSSTHEEVNVIESGKNYGWPAFEGNIEKNACDAQLGENINNQAPLVAFPRSVANSVTGGYVYRGEVFPELYGKYICGDWGVGGELWAVDLETGDYNQIGSTVGATTKMVSIAQDKKGELYVLTGGDNVILDRNSFEPLYKIVRSDGVTAPPATLSATGAFSNLENLTPNSGVVPYDLYESFWSDNAIKTRWLVVPNDGDHNTAAEQIQFSKNGEWQFPQGSVLIKHFELPLDARNPSVTRRLETRFIVIGQDSKVYGLTYKWRADGSDADLLETSLDEEFTVTNKNGVARKQQWHYPSNSECISCHNSAVGGTLGPKTRYLNENFTYPSTGIQANQLVTLSHLGMLSENITDASVKSMPRNVKKDDESASLEQRAKSYLDLNCAYCHRPGTGNRAVFDARMNTPLFASNLLSENVIEPLGISGAKIIAPGSTANSVLYHRVNSVDESIMMPPLSKNLIDEEGVALLSQYIKSLDPDLNYEFNSNNLAFEKTTRQSSNYDVNRISSLAVDGNTNGVWKQGSIAHTKESDQPWWEVDLGDNYFISEIKLFNRTDCCLDRLKDFYVFTSKTPFVSDSLEDILNQPGVEVNYHDGFVKNKTSIYQSFEGRYVRVQLSGQGYLGLAEVEVFGDELPKVQANGCSNVAINKTANQSSLWNFNDFNFEASNAIDGNNDGFDSNNSITATIREKEAWWEVDLEGIYDLTAVKLWNRDVEDCSECPERLSDFYVISSALPFVSKDLSATLQQPGVKWVYYTDSAARETYFEWPEEARYVRVQLAGREILTLAEVEVFSSCDTEVLKEKGIKNLALLKRTEQSSNYAGGFGSDKAVDGNVDGFDENKSITATKFEYQSWWEVDLGQLAKVDQIRLWNRDKRDCSVCPERLSDFYVISSEKPFVSKDLEETLAQPNVRFEKINGVANRQSILEWGGNARYVRVQLEGINYLTLAEVEVLGSFLESSLKAALDLEEQNMSDFKIYPNPANTILNISLQLETDISVIEYVVYSLDGKVVLKEQGTPQYKLNVSNLSNGVYILQAISNDQVFNAQRLIIQR